LEYAHVNPSMGIPSLEIDDQIICDSHLIQQYLTEKYPGPGDQQAPRAAMNKVIDLMLKWDEGLWSYKRMPGEMGVLLGQLKLLRLHQNLKAALEHGQEGEVLGNGKTLLECYVKKLAWQRHMNETACQELTPEVERKIEQNEQNLEDLFQLADDHLATAQPYLFGQHLTSADAFFCNVLFRMGSVKGELEKAFKGHDRVAKYWEKVQETEVFQRSLGDYSTRWAFCQMIKNGVPFKLLGVKCGLPCMRIPELPAEIERDIEKDLVERRRVYMQP